MRARNIGLIILLIAALAGVGHMVLSMRAPKPSESNSEVPAPPDMRPELVCADLKLALSHAKTGFSDIMGQPTRLPYISGNGVATDYPTTLSFPSSEKMYRHQILFLNSTRMPN